MNGKKAKLTALLLAGAFGCTAFCAGACTTQSETQSDTPPSGITEPYFNLEVWNYRLYVGDSRLTIVQAFGLNEPLVYTSSNPDIVSLGKEPYNQTRIYAHKAGEVTITVRYGYFEDTIRVISTFGELQPELQLKEGVRDRNRIKANEPLDLSAKVFFNKKYFEATDITYQIRRDGVVLTDGTATVQDSKFTASAGIYEVTLTATWSNYVGEGLTKTVTVEVAENK